MILKVLRLEDGQGLTEYALILGLAAAAIGMLSLVGTQVSNTLWNPTVERILTR